MPVATDTTPRIRSATIVVVSGPRPVSRRRPARTAVLSGVFCIVALHAGLTLGMDTILPQIRDPEYGRRLHNLRRHKAEDPARPVTVVFGSSRTAMGVRPDVVNRPGVTTFNFALVGSGPVMQLMALRRLLADGVTPDAAIFEFWPAFLREDGPFDEEARIDVHRLLPIDTPFVNDYFDTHEHTGRIMREIRWRPWYEHRLRLMSQIAPGWLPFDRRMDHGWQKLDAWGWLPGLPKDPPADERTLRHQHARQYYQLAFHDFHVHRKAERAMREILTICRERSIPAKLLWLPESTEFASWYSPDVLARSERFLAELRTEFSVPMIDARRWVPDPHLQDGFHLTQPGAAVLSDRLGEFLRGEFLRGSP